MRYIYVYDITNGKIMAKTISTANYKKMQDNFNFETDIIYSDKDLKDMLFFQYQVNLETKELERKPV